MEKWNLFIIPLVTIRVSRRRRLLFYLFLLRFRLRHTGRLWVCRRGRRRTRLDHRFSLGRHPEMVNRRLIPHRLAVFLHKVV